MTSRPGLGIKECQYLDGQSSKFTDNELVFRKNEAWNWQKIREIIEASQLPEPKFSITILNKIKNKIDVIESWLSGKTILEISHTVETKLTRKSLNNTVSFLYGYVSDELSWANAGLIKLIEKDIQEKNITNLDYEFYLLPSYLKYGVNNAGALLLCLAGLGDRDIANKISHTCPIINNVGSNWIDIINWVLNLPNDTYDKIQESLLDNLAHLDLPLNEFKGIKGPCDIDKKGNVIQINNIVGKLAEKNLRTVSLIDGRNNVTKRIDIKDGKPVLEINYS